MSARSLRALFLAVLLGTGSFTLAACDDGEEVEVEDGEIVEE